MSRRQRASHGWWTASEPADIEDDYDYYDDDPGDASADPWPPSGPPSGPPGQPPHPPAASAALRHARPNFDGPTAVPGPDADVDQASWTNTRAWTGSSPLRGPQRGDPMTDPHGFTPVGAHEPAPQAPVDRAEASALAAAFATDYFSWDETDPQRRGRVLAHYLADGLLGNDSADAAQLGWSGRGRQRAEFALPGAVLPDGDARVTVDVRVRVTPYRAVGAISAGPPEDEAEVAGVPAAAPAPTARGWKSLGSYWVRLSVPVARERGRLVVDASDEQLGGRPPPARTSPPKPPAVDEPDVDGDDVDPPADQPATRHERGAGRKTANGRRR